MTRCERPNGIALSGLLLVLLNVGIVRADFQLGVTFNDPTSAYSSYYSAIQSNLQAAGADWASRLVGSGTIDVRVDFASIPTTTGNSLSSGFLFSDGSYSYFAQGAAYKIQTGIDVNGSTPDALITIGTDYLQHDLWFDPSPGDRTAPVPSNKVDAYSVLLHELGHVLVFNGWRDPTTGGLPGAYMSAFDAQIIDVGGGFALNGPAATNLYGGPVPLTAGNLVHLGNAAPGAGSDLLGDLMNGVEFARGRRYGISALDLAIAADSGLAVVTTAAVPEPSSLLLLSLGGISIWVRARRSRHGVTS